MAREQLNYTATAWKDLEAGGTAITAARLNNIETGIADADAAVNAVNATVLTYLVASDGDTATTDINGAAITGPCFVHDLGTGDTYLDKGQDGQGRVQVGVSKAAFDALQESVTFSGSATGVQFSGWGSQNEFYIHLGSADLIFILPAEGGRTNCEIQYRDKNGKATTLKSW